MRKYHSLTVTEVLEETPDSVRIGLEVPPDAADEFDFLPGQHLPLRIEIDGKSVRRTYSICSVPGEKPLHIGVRVQKGGRFSEYAANQLKAGDRVESMPPFGQFHANLDAAGGKTRLAFAAGSGITPILSIIRATLEREPAGRFILFYGNRRQQTTMFIDDLFALKNRFPERLLLYFVFSREEQEFDIFSGRLDEHSVPELYEAFCRSFEPDEAFVCGPDTMTETVSSALAALGMDADAIHVERFGAPRKGPAPAPADVVEHAGESATIDVIMDGHRKSFRMPIGEGNIVDAAAEQGIDLPYSCKGGVCATCRTHVREGEVHMAANYGLEPWEIEAGFVLACQCTPQSEKLTLDYDKT